MPNAPTVGPMMTTALFRSPGPAGGGQRATRAEESGGESGATNGPRSTVARTSAFYSWQRREDGPYQATSTVFTNRQHTYFQGLRSNALISCAWLFLVLSGNGGVV